MGAPRAFMRRRCATGAVVFVSVVVGLMPGRERQSPQERRLCAETPCLAAGLGERAAVSRQREREKRERERETERKREGER